jgi:hypothetical protein
MVINWKRKEDTKTARQKRKPPKKGGHDYASLIHVALVINTYINIVTVCLNLFHVAASQNHSPLYGVPTADSNVVPTDDSYS